MTLTLTLMGCTVAAVLTGLTVYGTTPAILAGCGAGTAGYDAG